MTLVSDPVFGHPCPDIVIFRTAFRVSASFDATATRTVWFVRLSHLACPNGARFKTHALQSPGATEAHCYLDRGDQTDMVSNMQPSAQ